MGTKERVRALGENGLVSRDSARATGIGWKEHGDGVRTGLVVGERGSAGLTWNGRAHGGGG